MLIDSYMSAALYVWSIQKALIRTQRTKYKELKNENVLNKHIYVNFNSKGNHVEGLQINKTLINRC